MNPSLILYPLSLLPSGQSALSRALEIARWHGAEVHVLLVRGRRASLAPVAMPLADARREPRLARFVDSINPGETRVSIVELTGDPVAAVSDYAKQTAADLIVVAKHGRPYGTYWRPGAYATDLARTASCPTLAVPETEAAAPNPKAPFVELLYPTDLSSTSALSVNVALKLAQQSAGRLTLLHVLKAHLHETVYFGARAIERVEEYEIRAEKAKRELRRLVPFDAYESREVEATVATGVAHRSILAKAAEVHADLIVMGLPDRKAIDRVVMGSTISPVLRGAKCPVLLVPSNRAEQRPTAAERAPGGEDHVDAGFVMSRAVRSHRRRPHGVTLTYARV